MKYAPVDLKPFKLTVPVTCPAGKSIRIAMNSADRPWCVAMQAVDRNLLKVGGRIGDTFVRDLSQGQWDLELQQAMSTTLPGYRRAIWTVALDGGRLNFLAPVVAQINGKTLDPYQIDAVENHLTIAGAAITFSVGLGKTLTAMSATERLLVQNTPAVLNRGMWTVMVVCPLNAMPVWTDPDVVKWFETGMRQHANYMVVSQDSLHKIQAMQVMGPSVLIVDEAHGFANWSAQRTKLLHKIRWQFDACLPLTGSLTHAGPDKVLSILDLVCPGAAIFGNVYEFGHSFECMYDKDVGNGVIKKAFGRPPAHLKDAYQKYLDRFVIAKTKHSPDVMVSTYIPEQEIHDVELFDPKTQPSMLDEAGAKAIEIFNATKAIPSMMEVVHSLARDGLQPKIDWLDDMMEDFTDQVVLFATYHETLNAVEDWLKATGLSYARIDGNVTGDERATLIQEFRDGKHQIMLAQTDAASVSMNLQTARISVMLDTTQKAANFEQALGRTCRRGSTQLCHHFNLAGNRFQQYVFNRLRLAMDFNSSIAEWQDMKRAKETALGVAP